MAERLDHALKQCLDHAAEGLHWVGPDGTILWANQTELTLLGYTADEYIGHNIAEFHVDRVTIADILHRLTNGETLRNYEARLRAKDGSIRDVEINSNVLWRDNAFLHTRCFTRDVTDRKVADDLARRLKGRDRFLVELDDGVRALTDAETITFAAAKALGEHLAVDRCAYATVEDDEDSFVLTGNYTNGVKSIVGRYTFTQFGQECLRLMRAGEPYVVADSETDPRVTSVERPSYAATVIRSVVCVPILKRGRFVAAMAVHATAPRQWERDEVELVQLVASRCWESIERARVTQELRAANRAKDEFLAMLGHELRNPLSPILTALQLMKLRGSDDSERERTVIERQVNHLTRLVDDLLDVSRIARGKVELKEEIVAIAEVVAKAIEITSPLLEDRKHTLDVAVPRRDLFVKGDITRLTQVMSNLINNAAKYTAPGGHITVAAGDEDGDVVLRVRDTGIGIAAHAVPRVFDLFVQERQGIDRSQGGLGLGLTIVRNLVERHGGRVSAHSDGPGTGSEFVVRLPKAMATARPESRSKHPVGGARSAGPTPDALRILVVDDNVDGAEMLAMALREKGYNTRVAHDAPAALNVAAEFRPDVAFLDIGLPVMDGYELAARLRERRDANQTRLIALTGYGQESDRRKTREAGFEHHLVKPVDLDAIEALLASARST